MNELTPSVARPLVRPSRGGWVKRAFDLSVGLVALLCATPLFVLFCALMKCSSKGPIFYSSVRLGLEGRSFTCWKLRSMHCDAEARLNALLKQDAQLKQEWQTYFKLKKDPRLTSLGKFLRSTSLDELPQLWNVVRGDLSLVGPRPYLPRELATIRSILGEKTSTLFSVRPGLTGPWQTSGRNCLTFEERVRMEVLYPQSASFGSDLLFILKTIPVLLLRKGAF